jgi:hypothetical protein
VFFRRGVSDDDPWLQVKLWIFTVGALLALLGMILQNDWLVGAAGVVLGAGVLLRFVGRGQHGQESGEEGSDAGDDEAG